MVFFIIKTIRDVLAEGPGPLESIQYSKNVIEGWFNDQIDNTDREKKYLVFRKTMAMDAIELENTKHEQKIDQHLIEYLNKDVNSIIKQYLKYTYLFEDN